MVRARRRPSGNDLELILPAAGGPFPTELHVAAGSAREKCVVDLELRGGRCCSRGVPDERPILELTANGTADGDYLGSSLRLEAASKAPDLSWANLPRPDLLMRSPEEYLVRPVACQGTDRCHLIVKAFPKASWSWSLSVELPEISFDGELDYEPWKFVGFRLERTFDGVREGVGTSPEVSSRELVPCLGFFEGFLGRAFKVLGLLLPKVDLEVGVVLPKLRFEGGVECEEEAAAPYVVAKSYSAFVADPLLEVAVEADALAVILRLVGEATPLGCLLLRLKSAIEAAEKGAAGMVGRVGTVEGGIIVSVRGSVRGQFRWEDHWRSDGGHDPSEPDDRDAFLEGGWRILVSLRAEAKVELTAWGFSFGAAEAEVGARTGLSASGRTSRDDTGWFVEFQGRFEGLTLYGGYELQLGLTVKPEKGGYGGGKKAGIEREGGVPVLEPWDFPTEPLRIAVPLVGRR